MKKQKIGKLIYCLLSFIFISFFSYAKISLEIDKSKMYISESMELKLIYENADNKDAEIEGLENFDVVARGRKVQTTITNGKKTKVDIEIYRIVSKKAGNFELVARDSKGEESNKALIEVSDEIPKEQNSYFETFRQVDKRDYYLGEKIVFKEGVKSRINLSGMSYLNKFEVEGGGLKNFNQERIETNVINENGVNYLVANSFEGIIEPFGSGELIIPKNAFKIAYEISSNSFFNDTKEEYAPLNEIKLNIMPLPEENKPADFSGLVGTLIFDSSLDRNEVEEGQGISMTLTLRGNANLAAVDKIFDKEVEGFRIFEKVKSFDEGLRDGKYHSEKVYEIVFIPLKAELMKLPDIKITYFDTEKKAYSLLSVEGKEVKIKKASESIMSTENEGNTSLVDSIKISELPESSSGISNKFLICVVWVENIIIIVLIFFLIRSKIGRRKKKNTNKAFIGKFEKVVNVDEFYKLLFEYIRENYNINPESINFGSEADNFNIPEELSSIVLKTEEYKFQNKILDKEIKAEIIDFLRRT